jgi:hypothetical protein
VTAPKKLAGVVPPPEHQLPDCPLCWNVTEHDGDLLQCQTCRIGWYDDWCRPGFRLDEDAPQCTAEISPWPGEVTLGHVRYRCVLNDGHKSVHAGGRIDNDDNGASGARRWSGPVPAGKP